MIRSEDVASYSDVLASVQPGGGEEQRDCRYETKFGAIATLRDLLLLDLEHAPAAAAFARSAVSGLRSQME